MQDKKEVKSNTETPDSPQSFLGLENDLGSALSCVVENVDGKNIQRRYTFSNGTVAERMKEGEPVAMRFEFPNGVILRITPDALALSKEERREIFEAAKQYRDNVRSAKRKGGWLHEGKGAWLGTGCDASVFSPSAKLAIKENSKEYLRVDPLQENYIRQSKTKEILNWPHNLEIGKCYGDISMGNARFPYKTEAGLTSRREEKIYSYISLEREGRGVNLDNLGDESVFNTERVQEIVRKLVKNEIIKTNSYEEISEYASKEFEMIYFFLEKLEGKGASIDFIPANIVIDFPDDATEPTFYVVD